MSQDIPPTGNSPSSFSDDMLQYLQVYIDESGEELEGLIEAILMLEENPKHIESLNKAFRMLHSLKGSSGMLGFEVVGNFAHELEDRFERYRAGQATLNSETTTVVLQCVDYLRAFLDRLRAGELIEGDPSALLEQLRSLERGGRITVSSPHHESSPPAGSATVSPVTLPIEMTVTGGLKILVRFRPGLQLADLKARLIVSRLSSIGEIISCDPPIDDAHSFDELPLFSLMMVTDRKLNEVRKIANVDGVESIEIEGGELTAALLEKAAEEATTASPPPDRGPTAVPNEQQVAPMVEPIALNEPVSAKPTVATAETSEAKVSTETLRVETGRLDRLMNLTGELVVANARFGKITGDLSPLFRQAATFKKSKELSERLRERFEQLRQLAKGTTSWEEVWPVIAQGLQEDLDSLDHQADLLSEGHRQFAELNSAVDQLGRVSKNLQRGVLDTRMVPIGPLFNRFKRVIRDLSSERDKNVQLVIQGEKTELDKKMIDALGDPLLHLVRNSIDHGLEPTEQRLAAGKPESGTIVLEAAHRGNSVWITVRDDGAGINADKIRHRVVERGLASELQVQEMTDAQLIDFIWHPGFSTAEAVTEISGRGVGMDIVRNAISELNGTIDVVSTPQVGTTFTIRLPLTLAIIHSLMMRFRGDCYSIPIDDVREIVSIPRSQVHAVHRHKAIDVRGELIPLVSMQGVFDWSGSATSPASGDSNLPNEMINVVIIQTRGKTLGLTVDSLVGRAGLVIKSLTENFQPVRGLSGASILGDGAVCLMLDPAAVLELATERSRAGGVC